MRGFTGQDHLWRLVGRRRRRQHMAIKELELDDTRGKELYSSLCSCHR